MLSPAEARGYVLLWGTASNMSAISSNALE